MNSIFIVLPILTILMFDLGLTLAPRDFAVFARKPRPVIVGLVGQLAVLPLVAFAVGSAFSLPPVFLVGLVLIACCPGGSSSNIFSKLAGGDVSLSVTLTALSSVITLFTIPFILQIATASHAVSLPVGQLLVQNIMMMLLPIALGMALKHFCPKAAEKTDRILARCAFPALILLASIFFIQHRQTIADNLATLGLSVFTLLIASILCGAALSLLFRIKSAQRRTIIIEIGMQNAAQAIAIAASPFVLNDSAYAIPAIIYALLMNVVLLVYVGLIRSKQ